MPLTHYISTLGPDQLDNRRTTRHATICESLGISTGNEDDQRMNVDITVEAIAAGTLNITLMIGLKSRHIKTVAMRLARNLKTYFLVCAGI